VNDDPAYRPPEAVLAATPKPPLEPASRGARLGAKLLDGLLLGAVGVTTGGIPATVLLMGRPWNRFLAEVAGGCGLSLGLVALVVWNCVWLDRYGQTIGKRILGIRIVRSNGEPATLGRIFLYRFLPVTLLGGIPVLGTLLTFTDILLIFRDSRKCLHDQFADTIVVKAE
jgi:uncharacterized RDD family membrane protein YckC